MVLNTPINKYDEHPWWVGVSGGFRPGNFDISGQFIYNGGKRQFSGATVNGMGTATTLPVFNATSAANVTAGGQPSNGTVNTSTTTPLTLPSLQAVQGDSTYQAWAGELAVKYRVGPGLFAGVEGFYATGQDWNKPDKITSYEYPTSSEGLSIFGNDRTVFMWMNAAQIGYYYQRNTAASGFYYARANVEFSPLTWLRMNLNYLYIGDTSSGNTGPGAAQLAISPATRTVTQKLVNSPIGARQDVDKSFVGQELNLITTLRIYQNFDYNIGAYVFFPSDMFDRVDNITGRVIAGATTSYGVNTKLIYAF